MYETHLNSLSRQHWFFHLQTQGAKGWITTQDLDDLYYALPDQSLFVPDQTHTLLEKCEMKLFIFLHSHPGITPLDGIHECLSRVSIPLVDLQ